MIEQPSRRGLLTGLGALFIAAPAIVRATSIMPIKAVEEEVVVLTHLTWSDESQVYKDLTIATRRAFVPRIIVRLYDYPDPMGEVLGV